MFENLTLSSLLSGRIPRFLSTVKKGQALYYKSVLQQLSRKTTILHLGTPKIFRKGYASIALKVIHLCYRIGLKNRASYNY